MDIKTSFSILPNEIKLYCFSFLNMKETIELRLVCSEWKQLADDQSLWSRFLPNYVLNPPSAQSGEQMREAIREVCITAHHVTQYMGEERLVGRVILDPRPLQAGDWIAFMGEDRHCVRLWSLTRDPFDIEVLEGRSIADWTLLHRKPEAPVLVLLERAEKFKELSASIHLWSMASQPTLLRTITCSGDFFFAASRVRPLNSDRDHLAVANPNQIQVFDPFQTPIKPECIDLEAKESLDAGYTFVKGIGSMLAVQWQSDHASSLMLFQCSEGNSPKKKVEITELNGFAGLSSHIDNLVEIHDSSWANARVEIESKAWEGTLNAEGLGVHQVWGDSSGLLIDHIISTGDPTSSVIVHDPKIAQRFTIKGAQAATWVTGLAGLKGIRDYLIIPAIRKGDSENELEVELKVRMIPREEDRMPRVMIEKSQTSDLQAAPVPGVLGAIAVRMSGYGTRIYLFNPLKK